MERETGIEPATSSLGSWRSTAELLPLSLGDYHRWRGAATLGRLTPKVCRIGPGLGPTLIISPYGAWRSRAHTYSVLADGRLVQGGVASGDLIGDILLLIALIAFELPALIFVDSQGEAFFVPGAGFAPSLHSLCPGGARGCGHGRVRSTHN
jgi:hypothetical protein